eukprot:jgi/Chlat1/8405/Chrsp80S07839
MAAAAAAAAESAVAKALADVLARAASAAQRAGGRPTPRVVAVSKTKPVAVVREAYDAGHRVFGENYVQELMEKAPQMPRDVRWHFIGHLQSNKAKQLLTSVPNLAMVETVDRMKIANSLNSACTAAGRPCLDVMVQVNTSGEETKYGVEPAGCVELVQHMVKECDRLRFAGLMTIGMPDYSSRPENFQAAVLLTLIIQQTLARCREQVCTALGIPIEACELSMGMSGDYEQAIEMGSTNVRVGSTIFGARDYAKT